MNTSYTRQQLAADVTTALVFSALGYAIVDVLAPATISARLSIPLLVVAALCLSFAASGQPRSLAQRLAAVGAGALVGAILVLVTGYSGVAAIGAVVVVAAVLGMLTVAPHGE